MNYIRCRDRRGVVFDVYDDLLYVEERIIKICDVSVTYSFARIIKPKEIECNMHTDTWVLHAYETGVSDQEITIHGKLSLKHPKLYCLKTPPDVCLMGYEAQKPMTGQL